MPTPRRQPATQQRSRETERRILDAAEALMDRTPFDAIGVHEIAAEAGVAVGSVYARFGSKAGLLDGVYARHQASMASLFAAAFSPELHEGRSLGEIIEWLAFEAVSMHRRHRGMLRSLLLRSRAEPDERYKTPGGRRTMLVESFRALVERRREEVRCDDPGASAQLAAVAMLGSLREVIVFDDYTASPLRIDDADLARRIAGVMKWMLGVAGSGGPPEPGSFGPSRRGASTDAEGEHT